MREVRAATPRSRRREQPFIRSMNVRGAIATFAHWRRSFTVTAPC